MIFFSLFFGDVDMKGSCRQCLYDDLGLDDLLAYLADD